MKQRFSSLDVKVIAHELHNSLSSLRLANIYDLSSRIFLFKFAKSEQREQLVVESGFRCHLTNFSRATAAAPSGFVARLRKFLRSRRVTSVSQIGTDRIIRIQFSDGQYNLFLEFYAAGNIILTDADLKILAVLRIVSEGAEHEEVRQGLPYSLSHRQNYDGVPPLTSDRVRNGIQKALEDDVATVPPPARSRRKAGDSLRRALAATVREYPPVLVDHVLYLAKFDASIPLQTLLQDEGKMEQLVAALTSAEEVVQSLTKTKTVPGFIIAKPKAKDAGSGSGNAGPVSSEQQGGSPSGLLYEGFHPFAPQKLVDDPSITILPFEGFNKTVDEYFSSIEGQKLESRLQDREEHARRKLENARKDHMSRLGSLQSVQELNIRRAQAIEGNVDRVEEAIKTVNGLIGQGMDWVEIGRLIELEQKRQNPLAEMIKLPLKLQENTITLLLDDSVGEEGEDDEVADQTDSDVSDSGEEQAPNNKKKAKIDSGLSIDIDLSLSPWGNARQYYDQKRSAAEKEQKTLQQSTKALKNTERKVNADLAKGLKQEKEVLRPVRRQFWFEKFIYFVSSDGYLVLGGRDAQQNEILYRRYFRRGDIYVHADLEGAATMFIKNDPSTPEAPIPPYTLSQAGTLSISTSSAWDSKAVMSAWWVGFDQVTKTLPTGDYVTGGNFVIRGTKNYLPPAQLVLGFSVLFQISDESKAKHLKHRLQNEDEANVVQEDEPKEAIETEAVAEQEDASDESEDEDFPDAKLESGSEDEGPVASDSVATPVQTGSLDEPDTATLDVGTLRIADDDQMGSLRQDEAAVGSTKEDSDQSDDDLDAAPGQNEIGQGHEESDGASEPESADPLTTNQLGATKGLGSVSKKPAPARQVRGKHGKKKKLATKYKDQDEEDRQLAMKLLGSAAAQAKAQEEAQTKQARDEAREAQKERRREQHLRAAREGLAHEERRRMTHEVNPQGDRDGENEDEDEKEEQQKTTAILSSLVGTPLPGDEILSAIPVCAPWSALAKYKYKVKLQPGTTKKGKAVKEILSRWLLPLDKKREAGMMAIDMKSEDVEKSWPKELELIKGWKESEIFNVVPVGKVKVVASSSLAKGAGGGDTRGKRKGGRGGKGSKR
ncbi:MAG: hypothetical protein M1823_002355 [Watsoniomyces obsoletus]|nr:MAG: hypothetical protein M1823_002355 [Watsoniomyces obsoletus]